MTVRMKSCVMEPRERDVIQFASFEQHNINHDKNNKDSKKCNTAAECERTKQSVKREREKKATDCSTIFIFFLL